MERRETKTLSCKVKGPGPVYKLPTLVGYTDHDPSRHRNPAYTIRPKTGLKPLLIGPGPRYNVSKLTKSGQDNPPAYSIKGREALGLRHLGPGPGTYSPEKCPLINHNRRAPAYSIKSRHEAVLSDGVPSPNSYSLPTCIGPKVPDKPAQGAFSITGHHEMREIVRGPGPAAYAKLDYNLVKHRDPAYSLKGRHFLSEKYRSPAPTFYPLYDTQKRAPMYSFGIKHSECAGLPIIQQDEDD
ncbi:PREDICTED: outer dense fiber protein 3-like [Dinoponera quadriceps]|uniref:Outer dense fiber protein 3-like n=1 Tax=Dinoponera quadriceps TaxID=609295 RepID=A0A6P3XQP5_DINQU|nr:PREDICTED: outer dense fiber protein 3-like [Dinoponera quadriceps]